VKLNGRIQKASMMAALTAALLAVTPAHAEDTRLPVVGNKLYPMRFNPEISFQVDYSLADKYTSHQGARVSGLFHIWDNLAVEAYAGYLFGSESSIMKTLRDKSRDNRNTPEKGGREPALPGLQQLTYHLGVDGQFAPIYGKLSFVSEFEASFQLYGLGGIGLAGTRTITDNTLLGKSGCNQIGGISKGCADLYAGPAKLASLPSISPGGNDIFGAGEFQLAPLAVPVEYGLGLRVHMGKWVALRAEIRNYHWLGINNKMNINVVEDAADEQNCTAGYRVANPVLDPVYSALTSGGRPCYLNLHTVTLANAGLSITIPVNSFF
jgi:outer membrane beta-barrel protein